MLFDPSKRMVMRVLAKNYHNPDAPSVVNYSGMYGLEVPCIYGYYSLMDDYANHGSAEWRSVEGVSQWVNITTNPYKHRWTQWTLMTDKPIQQLLP
jgi:hypothetical protein